MTETPTLRSARTQVQYLCQGFRPLEERSEAALLAADRLQEEDSWKATHPFLAVVFSPAAYRILTTSVALEVWERLSELPAHVEIAALRHGHAQYVPGQFVRTARTREAMKRLYQAQPGPLLVVPVRIELLHPALAEGKQLEADEFEFPLAGTLAVLASHAKVWEPEQRKFMFAALGEHFGSSRQFAAVEAGESTFSFPVAGIRGHSRFVSSRHASELHSHFAITGLVR